MHIVIEIFNIIGSTIGAMLRALFSLFPIYEEISNLKEQLIAAFLNVPVSVIAFISVVVTIVSFVIKKFLKGDSIWL